MREGWHLDKKVPLSIILVLLSQTVAVVSFLVKLENKVELTQKDVLAVRETTQKEMFSIKQQVSDQGALIDVLRGAQNSIGIGLARIEERQIITAEGVREIKARLDARK